MTNEFVPPDQWVLTPVNRVMEGLEAEINGNPDRFFNFQYLQGLINHEAAVVRNHTKTFRSLLFLNAFSLLYVQGIKINFEIFGQSLDQIPSLIQILCLLLGLNLYGFSITSLDVVLLARIRCLVIHKCVGTDLPNIATVHLKGNGVWVDLITPRFIGYSSGKKHQIFSNIVGFIMIAFLGAIFLASGTSLIGLYLFGLKDHPLALDWPTIIFTVGLAMGIFGIGLVLWTQFFKFNFVLPEPIKTSQDQSILYPKD